jgi:dephospho-CoA kinase
MRSIVIAGPVCAGKTTLAREFELRGWRFVSARQVIAERGEASLLNRSILERLGRLLESTSPGVWLAEAAAERGEPVVLDSIRTDAQALATRNYLPGCVLVHLTAEREVRRERFMSRVTQGVDDKDREFSEIADSRLERTADNLAAAADLAIDTGVQSPSAIVRLVIGHLDT